MYLKSNKVEINIQNCKKSQIKGITSNAPESSLFFIHGLKTKVYLNYNSEKYVYFHFEDIWYKIKALDFKEIEKDYLTIHRGEAREKLILNKRSDK